MPATGRKRPAPDYGSADDFQLKQVLNQLEGLPLALSKHALATALARQNGARGAAAAQSR